MHLSFICGEREGEELHLLAINEGGGGSVCMENWNPSSIPNAVSPQAK